MPGYLLHAQRDEPPEDSGRPATRDVRRLEPLNEAADLFDWALLRDYLKYGVGSARRHKLLMFAIAAGVIALTVFGLHILPRTWRVQTEILAQRNQVMASLNNPGRSMPGEFDAPTRAAEETVLNHDNLVSLIHQTNLVERWDKTRAPAVHWKDEVMQLLFGKPTNEDKLDALVGLLEKRLTVETGDGTVTITVVWPDAQLAYRLADGAEQNFLEARHVSEISTIAESISILEGHAAGIAELINFDIDQLQQSKDAKSKERAPQHFAGRPRPDSDLVELRLMVLAKRRAIADLEEFRQKRLDQLQAELASQRAVYADQHPLVADTLQMIAAMREDSPQMTALRRQEAELAQEYARRAGARLPAKLSEAAEVPAGRSQVTDATSRLGPATAQDDPGLTALRSRLDFALEKYNALLDRIDSARIELDTARAAFKYRYSVIKPPQVPRTAEKPKRSVVLTSGVVAGSILALFAALALDLLSGLLFERWQIERSLGLTVLATVKKS